MLACPLVRKGVAPHSLSICCMGVFDQCGDFGILATRLDKRCTGPVALEYSVSTVHSIPENSRNGSANAP